MIALFRFWFWLKGWKVDLVDLRDYTKGVVLAAPHTSNWDMVYSGACFDILGLPVKFAIKKEWLRFPFGILFRSMGAIGIDRSPRTGFTKRKSTVEAISELFDANDELLIMIAPEGTRSHTVRWKTGFYHIALKANVPLMLGYLDYKTKTAGIGKVIYPSGNIKLDMQEIIDFYRPIAPKHPHKFAVDKDYE